MLARDAGNCDLETPRAPHTARVAERAKHRYRVAMPTTDGPPAAAPVDDTASQSDKLLTRTTIAVGAVVVALLIRRLRFGVDLTDEAFYVAMPYRFFVGDQPFVDEILIQQTAALMSYPLVAGFVETTGGTDGIVLFLRQAHLVFSLGIAGVVALGADELRSLATRHIDRPRLCSVRPLLHSGTQLQHTRDRFLHHRHPAGLARRGPSARAACFAR